MKADIKYDPAYVTPWLVHSCDHRTISLSMRGLLCARSALQNEMSKHISSRRETTGRNDYYEMDRENPRTVTSPELTLKPDATRREGMIWKQPSEYCRCTLGTAAAMLPVRLQSRMLLNSPAILTDPKPRVSFHTRLWCTFKVDRYTTRGSRLSRTSLGHVSYRARLGLEALKRN